MIMIERQNMRSEKEAYLSMVDIYDNFKKCQNFGHRTSGHHNST